MRGIVQSSETSELTAEAKDAESARELVRGQVADGFELLRVHSAKPSGGRVVAMAVVRPATIEEIEAEGADYTAAREALRAAVPEGKRLLSIVVVAE